MPKERHLRTDKIAALVMRGYPKQDVFTTMEEVRAYLDGDKVTCLLCGREYAALGGHLTRVHYITSDDYREHFGIPYKYGLASRTFRERASRHLRKLRKEGRIRYQPSKETMEKMWEARRNRRPIMAATQQLNRDKLRGYHGNRREWFAEDYEEFLRRIKSGRIPAEVGRDKDMPTHTAFWKYLNKTPEFRKRYEAMWENLPFAVQARANKSGERYKQTLVSLRTSGNTWAQVAAMMQVQESAVRGMWHVLKRTKKLKKYLNAT